MDGQLLGDTTLKRVTSPEELNVGQEYLYTEADSWQLEQFARGLDTNIDWIPARALCRKVLIYEGKTDNDFNFRIIQDTPSTCDRMRETSVGQMVSLTDFLFNPNNNDERLYHKPSTGVVSGRKFASDEELDSGKDFNVLPHPVKDLVGKYIGTKKGGKYKTKKIKRNKRRRTKRRRTNKRKY